jgi:phage baseplate assembly protein W
MPRVDRISPKEKQPEYYADIPLNMDRNLVTGQLARLTNDDAVKQSMVTLALTSPKERFYQPWIGCRIQESLFGLIDDPTVISDIRDSLQRCYDTNEPRVNIENVTINEDIEKNGYNVSVTFSSINIQQIETVDIFVSRVR